MTGLVAWVVGAVWWWLLPVRRRLAVENYRRCFPERDPGELRRGVGEAAVQYLELALGRSCEVRGAELLEGGGIVLAGHFAGWDLALVSMARRVPGAIFVRIPSSRLAALLVGRLRAQAPDLELLSGDGAWERALARLEAGGLVAFVQDQRHNAGVAVPFFGRPCLTSPGLAVAAWKTRVPLLGVSQWREGGRQVMAVERLEWQIPEDRAQAVAELTAATQAWYEAKIRLRPWSWLWLHDRWRGASPGSG